MAMSELLDQQDLQDAWEQAQPVTYAQTAYLVHNTCWIVPDVLKVYLSRPEADLAKDAAEALRSKSAGWVVSPFCYEGALGDTVRLKIKPTGYGEPYNVEVSVDGRVVADVYESDLGY
jgi:hypothetical protein